MATNEKTPLIGNQTKKNDDVTKKLIEKKGLNDSIQVIRRTIRRSCCHSFFILISIYSSFALLFLFTSQLAPLLVYDIRGLHMYLRVYIAFFSFILLMVELEVPYFSSTPRTLSDGNDNGTPIAEGFMDNWISRGILHSFLGLINQEESLVMTNIQQLNLQKSKTNNLPEAQILLDLFVQITSWMMVISGVLYALMGLFCLRSVKVKCQMKYRDDLQKEEQRLTILKDEKASGAV